ncbi:hypothetical protein ccbrp13_00810 [Ktedonobacteria bacterium brp13]|nr:hypothetical protein ccbrp13_00810 [Ktedonobacteria bacterium brp13]
MLDGAYQGHFLQLISDRTRLALQINYLYGVPADFEQTFGSLLGQHAQDLHSASLQPGDAYVSSTFALNNDVRVGDQVVLSLGERSVHLTIRGILANDIAFETQDATSIPKIEVIVPLATAQSLMQLSQPVNIIGIRQTASDAAHNTEIQQFLSRLLGVPLPGNGTGPILPAPPLQAHPSIHLLKSSAVAQTSGLSFSLLLSGNSFLQFSQLIPAITFLLIGAGMLLLALLFVLLAAERRAELGMSRAIGLQCQHLIYMLLIEGSGYGIVAALLALPLGIGIVALELTALTHFPVNILGSLLGLPMPLYLSVGWQSIVLTFCISFCMTFLVILCISFGISRSNIVSAIRDLDEPATVTLSLPVLWQRVQLRQSGAWGNLIGALFLRGPLCLLAGLALIELQAWLQRQKTDWLAGLASLQWGTVGWGLLIAGGGLLLSWIFALLPGFPNSFARRLGHSLIGVGWLMYGLFSSSWLFSLFQPTGTRFSLESAALTLALTMLLFVAGSVLLMTANIDLLVKVATAVMAHLPGFAPISRTSLAYPLTYRFRLTITLSEVSLVLFLVVLITTMNIGTNDLSLAAVTTGGFQLSGVSTRPIPQLVAQVRADPVLNRDIQVVAPIHRYMPDVSLNDIQPILITLPGRSPQTAALQTAVEDDAFYANTNLPFQARAQGYTSDQQVWNAVIHHANLVVMRFDSSIHGLPTTTFQPFTAQIPTANRTYYTVTVIGIISAATSWPFLYLSVTTGIAINHGAAEEARMDSAGLGTLFQVRPGVNISQASRDLSEHFGPLYGLQLQPLFDSSSTASRANMAVFLGSTLALGLLFGALAIGVIMSRAVIERRQLIGMLRALGFSRPLIMRSFLLESSFIILASMLIGTALALWVAFQIISSTYSNLQFPLPLLPIAAILIGSYLIAFLTTIVPARSASRIHPAEALRYE